MNDIQKAIAELMKYEEYETGTEQFVFDIWNMVIHFKYEYAGTIDGHAPYLRQKMDIQFNCKNGQVILTDKDGDAMTVAAPRLTEMLSQVKEGTHIDDTRRRRVYARLIDYSRL